MFLLTRTISQGRGAGFASYSGVAAGTAFHILLAALGLSAILATSAVAFTAVKTVGAAYLVFLGIKALIEKDAKSASGETKKLAKPFLSGFLTQTLNPKLACFMLALLPQFVDGKAAGPIPFLILGSIFIAIDTCWYSLLIVAASRAQRLFTSNEKLMGRLRKLSGVVYIGLGLNLLRAQRSAA